MLSCNELLARSTNPSPLPCDRRILLASDHHLTPLPHGHDSRCHSRRVPATPRWN